MTVCCIQAALQEDSARELVGMLIGKNALHHYVGGKVSAYVGKLVCNSKRGKM